MKMSNSSWDEIVVFKTKSNVFHSFEFEFEPVKFAQTKTK